MKPSVGSKRDTVMQSPHWYQELGLTVRIPRPPDQELRSLLARSIEPRIFLRPAKDTVDIVARFQGGCAEVFSPKQLKSLAKYGVTLQRAFEDTLSNKLGGKNYKARAEIAKLTYNVYRDAWLRFYNLVYRDHFHPEADRYLKDIAVDIETGSKIKRRGRRRLTNAETSSLRNRYCELLRRCQQIHRVAKDVAMRVNGVDARSIKKAILLRIRKHIQGMPSDHRIFSGAAFEMIPSGRKVSKLYAPQTWKPQQLAISILAFELNYKYQTVEKTIVPTKFRCPNRPT